MVESPSEEELEERAERETDFSYNTTLFFRREKGDLQVIYEGYVEHSDDPETYELLEVQKISHHVHAFKNFFLLLVGSISEAGTLSSEAFNMGCVYGCSMANGKEQMEWLDFMEVAPTRSLHDDRFLGWEKSEVRAWTTVSWSSFQKNPQKLIGFSTNKSEQNFDVIVEDPEATPSSQLFAEAIVDSLGFSHSGVLILSV